MELDQIPISKQIENEIIGNDVEAMLKKIRDEQHAIETAHLNQNFTRPIQYFQSKGAKKVQMRTKK